MLHFNNNNDDEGIAGDSLHKIRPLLQILKRPWGDMLCSAQNFHSMKPQWLALADMLVVFFVSTRKSLQANFISSYTCSVALQRI
jgi:hypothetical protein